MTERVVRAGGIEIATEAFGDPADPPVLLIMGIMASMLWWPEDFCTQLAGRGRHVIRYDHRDTGRSTAYETGKPGYTSADMTEDAVRVLSGYELAAAHLVGMSAGGGIAQEVAVRHPERVLTLTAISTSPIGIDTSGLPGASAAYREHAACQVDWTDRDQVVATMVEEQRLVAGAGRAFDAAAARRLIERDVDRARNFASATNHVLLLDEDDGDSARDIRAPLLVIHGTADPLFPVEHGVALAQAVPGARLLKLEGGGHALHPSDWNTIVAAIAAHTRHA